MNQKISYAPATAEDQIFMNEALAQAEKSFSEGGIPIGSVLVIDGRVVGRGHNRRVQDGDPILHGEMDCLKNAGRLSPSEYQRATLYTTLSPCDMCSGAALLYKIPRVVIAENETFRGSENLLATRGVSLVLLQDQRAISLMKEFIQTHPELWNEDIGVI